MKKRWKAGLAALVLLAAAVFVMAVSPWSVVRTQQERADRVDADTQLCDNARSLGELAASLGAQQETYDALKLSFATGVVTDNVGQSQLQSGQAEYDAGSEKLAAAKAKEVISDYKYRVELWRDKTIDSLENQNQMYLKMLNEYYQAKSPDGKKMKFPNGSIGIYAVRESYNWTDEKALLDYIMEESQNPDLEASGVFDGLLRYKAELNKDAIKSKLQFDSNGEAFINGIHIPFVEHVEKSEAFNVK